MNRRSGRAQSGSDSRIRRASAAPVAEKPGSVSRARPRSRRAPVDIAEGRGDRAGVVAQQRVARAEPERLVRASLRLLVAAEAMERPGQGIGGADGRGGRVARLRQLERRGRIAVIGLEQGQLDIDDDAAGLEELDLGAGELDVAGRLGGSAGRCLGVGQGDDVLGQRQDVRGALEQGDRLVEVAGTDRQPALPGERGCVPGHEREGPPVGVRGGLRVAGVDEQVAEQRIDEGDVLRREPGSRRRLLHRAQRDIELAVQFREVRDTGQCREVGPDREHLPGGRVGLVVAPELDERIDDDRPGRGKVRRQLDGLAAGVQRLGESCSPSCSPPIPTRTSASSGASSRAVSKASPAGA